jgi:prepilin-type processing-associated H-X9-DG protein
MNSIRLIWIKSVTRVKARVYNGLSAAKKRDHRKFGFSLIELLAVMGIIFMLVALLMPSLQALRENAKMIKCKNNLKQIHITTFLYANENHGFAPEHKSISEYANFIPRSHDVTHPSRINWDNKNVISYPDNKWFAEYFSDTNLGKSHLIAYCPKGGFIGDQGPYLPDKSTNNKSAPLLDNPSYGINPALTKTSWFYGLASANLTSQKNCVPLTQVRHPAEVALWMDATTTKIGWEPGAGPSGRHFPRGKRVPPGENATYNTYEVWQYFGKVNVIFVDGHVEARQFREEVPLSSFMFWEDSSVKDMDAWKKHKETDPGWAAAWGNGSTS